LCPFLRLQRLATDSVPIAMQFKVAAPSMNPSSPDRGCRMRLSSWRSRCLQRLRGSCRCGHERKTWQDFQGWRVEFHRKRFTQIAVCI
jgi:hypothetical protein